MAPEAHLAADEPVKDMVAVQKAEEEQPEVRKEESVFPESRLKAPEEKKTTPQGMVQTAEKEKEKEVDKDVLIRQILEEFMA